MAAWIQLANMRSTARPAQHDEQPKNEAAKSFFSIAMLQIRNGQRTYAISEAAVFTKFQWIHVDMKTNLLRNIAAKHDSKYKLKNQFGFMHKIRALTESQHYRQVSLNIQKECLHYRVGVNVSTSRKNNLVLCMK